MALTTQNISDILTGVTTFANTIAGQTQRISSAHEIIQAKAMDMGLQVIKGEGDEKPTANTDLADTHKILDTASAINSISINNLSSTTINAGSSYTIPKGYNKAAITITAAKAGTTLDSTTLVNSADLINGLTAYTVNSNKDVTKVTGTLTDYRSSGAISIGGATSYTNSGVTYTQFKVPNEGAYAANQQFRTTIPYRTPSIDASADLGEEAHENAVLVPVNVQTTAGETLITTETLPAGYYPKDIKLFPVFSKEDKTEIAGDNNIINILSNLSITGIGTLDTASDSYLYNAPTGFDYIKQVSVKKAAGSNNADGTYTVSTPGFITAGTYGVAFGGYPTAVTYDWKTAATTGKTYADKSITAQTSWIDLEKGHTDGKFEKVTVRSAVAALNAATITGTKLVTPTIASSAANTNVSISTVSTTKPSSGFYIAVQSGAASSTITSTSSVSVTTPGWVNSVANKATTATVGANASAITYVPIQVGSNTISELTAAADAITVGDSTIAKDNYYLKFDVTEGYQKPETKYVDLGASKLTTSGITYANGKFSGSATVSAGYQPGGTQALSDFSVTVGSGATLTTASATKSIAAKTYYPSAATVTVSQVNAVLSDSSSVANSNLSSTVKLQDLSANTVYTAPNNAFIKQITVNVTDIINALAAI